MNPEEVIKELSNLASKDLNDANVKKEALKLSKRLTATLEDPLIRAIELAFAPLFPAAARIAVDLDLFTRINTHDGPITSAQLASASGGEELLIHRILRVLAAVGFVHEVSNDKWTGNASTKAIASGPITAAHRFVWDIQIASIVKAPKFLRENKHVCPTEPRDGFIQYAHQSKLNFFELLGTMPSLLKDFNNFMGHTLGERQYWIDWYPIPSRLIRGFDPATPMLVDIGGGRGHDLQAFHDKFPESWKLFLQDLPQALKGIKEGELDPSIKIMEHDFFTEQPVKGARAYFLHHIFHNWADMYCLVILKHLRTAMTPGYSKLLIHELILPDSNATVIHGILDMVMMNINGGMERSRAQWTKLLEEAGFQVVEFMVPEDEDADGIVEAMVMV